MDKNLANIEKSATIICCDKACLSTNIMTCQHVFFDLAERICDTDDPMKAIMGDFYIYGSNHERYTNFLKLIRCGALCSNVTFINHHEINPNSNDTDRAIVTFCVGNIENEYQITITEYRKKHSKIFEIPFNNKNKWQLSIHKLPHNMILKNDIDTKSKSKINIDRCIIQIKGAPEIVLKICDRYLFCDEIINLDDKTRQLILDGIISIGSRGERVLAVAELILNPNIYDITYKFVGTNKNDINFPLNNLIFIGFFGMINPPRPGIPNAVWQSQQMGIKVVMITGDHPITAKAIAERCNIFGSDANTKTDIAKDYYDGNLAMVSENQYNAIIVTGDILQEMHMISEALKQKYIIFARVSSLQKSLIIDAFQQNEDIVIYNAYNDKTSVSASDLLINGFIREMLVQKNIQNIVKICYEYYIGKNDAVVLSDDFIQIVDRIKTARNKDIKINDNKDTDNYNESSTEESSSRSDVADIDNDNDELFDLMDYWELDKYAQILIEEKGYNDFEDWVFLNMDDLQTMNFEKNDANKFIKKVKYKLLKDWKLKQYAKKLIYFELDVWINLTENDLIKMQLKEGHAKRFLRKVKQLK